MRKIYSFIVLISLFTSVSSTVFALDCLPTLSNSGGQTPGCSWPASNRFDWWAVVFVGWGDGSPARNWNRAAFGQCNINVTCEPSIGVIELS